MPVIDPTKVPVKTGSIYPEPYAGMMKGRSSLRLGEAGGLTQFGVNLVNADFAQAGGQLVLIGSAQEIGRRTLQHGHMRRLLRERRNDRCGGCARSDHKHALTRIFRGGIPQLGMDEVPLVIGNPFPIGDIGVLMVVIALTHPEEAGGEGDRVSVGLAHGRHRPKAVLR